MSSFRLSLSFSIPNLPSLPTRIPSPLVAPLPYRPLPTEGTNQKQPTRCRTISSRVNFDTENKALIGKGVSHLSPGLVKAPKDGPEEEDEEKSEMLDSSLHPLAPFSPAHSPRPSTTPPARARDADYFQNALDSDAEMIEDFHHDRELLEPKDMANFMGSAPPNSAAKIMKGARRSRPRSAYKRIVSAEGDF